MDAFSWCLIQLNSNEFHGILAKFGFVLFDFSCEAEKQTIFQAKNNKIVTSGEQGPGAGTDKVNKINFLTKKFTPSFVTLKSSAARPLAHSQLSHNHPHYNSITANQDNSY